jgi:hypothetical protein
LLIVRKAQRTFQLKPDWQIQEYVCAENNNAKYGLSVAGDSVWFPFEQTDARPKKRAASTKASARQSTTVL